MKERLIEFLAYLGIGQTKFEEKVGLSRGFVHRLNDNITLKTLKKIMESYPELNEDWLKTGEGNMLKSEVSATNIDYKDKYIELLEENRDLLKENRELLKENRDLCRQLEFVKKGKVFEEA
jgi:hypothetical protein